jgi:hypothetical protein
MFHSKTTIYSLTEICKVSPPLLLVFFFCPFKVERMWWKVLWGWKVAWLDLGLLPIFIDLNLEHRQFYLTVCPRIAENTQYLVVNRSSLPYYDGFRTGIMSLQKKKNRNHLWLPRWVHSSTRFKWDLYRDSSGCGGHRVPKTTVCAVSILMFAYQVHVHQKFRLRKLLPALQLTTITGYSHV